MAMAGLKSCSIMYCQDKIAVLYFNPSFLFYCFNKSNFTVRYIAEKFGMTPKTTEEKYRADLVEQFGNDFNTAHVR